MNARRRRWPLPVLVRPTVRDHLTPTPDLVECAHCTELVADRPFPPLEDDIGWSAEAALHRPGCAAILTRNGARDTSDAPVWAHGQRQR